MRMEWHFKKSLLIVESIFRALKTTMLSTEWIFYPFCQ